MTKEENLLYRNAYVELNEIIKILNEEQKNKIPKELIENLQKNMNKNYSFEIDKTKGIFEQNLSIETQALLVSIYEKYLAPESEKQMWEKYDNFCLNKIEQERRKKYNPDNIFINDKTKEIKDEKNLQENLPIKIEKQSLFERIKNWFKHFFR